MKRLLLVALVLAGSLASAGRLSAQTPAAGDAAGTAQNQNAGKEQKPAATAPRATSGANPFPEDTGSVPVLPLTTTPMGSDSGSDDVFSSGSLPLAGDETDPVRSPDDPAPAASSGQEENSSSSLRDLESLLPSPDSDQPDKKKKVEKQLSHQEVASSDIKVGGYYLEKKNWRAALSRFQSAMVLDPENPEVYWGLAEAERHLGELANARAHYLQLLDYDPDGPHGKQARKALEAPEIANAQNPTPGQPAVNAPK